MKKAHKRFINKELQETSAIKSAGVKAGYSSIMRGAKRFRDENQEVLAEGTRERKVLSMKRHYTRNGWNWPPKQHHIASIVHMINNYYGKELVEHVPKDALEKKLGV